MNQEETKMVSYMLVATRLQLSMEHVLTEIRYLAKVLRRKGKNDAFVTMKEKIVRLADDVQSVYTEAKTRIGMDGYGEDIINSMTDWAKENQIDCEAGSSKSDDHHSLSPDEFEKLQTIKLGTDCLERVRDLFVFQTLMCFSYSDLSAFNTDNICEIDGMKVYRAKRNKIADCAYIPIPPLALDILNKYEGKLPVINHVKYNLYIKRVVSEAGINKPVSSHWARHTGVMILLSQGKEMKEIAKICGHSSPSILEKLYAKQSVIS